MKKSKKFAQARLVPALLTCALLFSVVPCTASAATSSFTPNSNNFRAVFDFESVPAAYTEGYKPGTRSDTVGLGKSQKAVNPEGLGLTYDLTIVKNDVLGGLALQIDVTDLAPENGAYCPIMLRPDYGDNTQIDVSGAEYFAFWVDTTGFINQEGEKAVKRMDFYVQEMDVEADGSVSTENATSWRPDYKKVNGEAPYYEYEDGKGGWLRCEDFTVLDFGLPLNYQGWIRFPLNTLVHTDFNTSDVDGVFNGKEVTHVLLGLGNYAANKGSVYLFDQIGFMGDFSSGSSETTPQQPDTTTNSPTEGADTTAGNSGEDTDPTVNVDPTGGDSTADATDGTNVSDTTTRSTSDNEDDESEPAGVGNLDDGGTGGSFPWGWIVAAVVVVILAGGGVTLYLLYKKGKLPFGKSSGGDGE